jgi:hypothetical protein
MAQKQTILTIQCANIHALHNALEPLDSITSSQLISIKVGASVYLPALVTISQRSHKSTLYITANNVSFNVTPRGKLTQAYQTL